MRSKNAEGRSIFEKGKLNQKRPFSEEETKALHDGFLKYGASWAKIGRDPVFQGRNATDLRDRFRNAFRDEYEQAGYKARPRISRKSSSSARSHHAAAVPLDSTAAAAAAGSSLHSASVSSNASAASDWSHSEPAFSDGNLTDHSSFSHDNATLQRESEVGPQRRRPSMRSARKSENASTSASASAAAAAVAAAAGAGAPLAYSDVSSSRASSFSQSSSVRPPLLTSGSSGYLEGRSLPHSPSGAISPLSGGGIHSATGGSPAFPPMQNQLGATGIPPLMQELAANGGALPPSAMARGTDPLLQQLSESLEDAQMADGESGRVRRTKSGRRRTSNNRDASASASNSDFARFSPSMMLNTARGSAHPLTEENLASQNGGGGFPWLSALQMQIAMQLQAQMSGSALYLDGGAGDDAGEGEGEGQEGELDGYDSEEEEDDEDEEDAQGNAGFVANDQDPFFSAPTVMQRAVEEMNDGEGDPVDMQFLQGLLSQWSNLNNADGTAAAMAGNANFAGLVPSAPAADSSQADQQQQQQQQQQQLQQQQQQQQQQVLQQQQAAQQLPAWLPSSSGPMPLTPEQANALPPEVVAMLTNPAAAQFDERGFDPGFFAEWLGDQATLDRGTASSNAPGDSSGVEQ